MYQHHIMSYSLYTTLTALSGAKYESNIFDQLLLYNGLAHT